jgi:hypothetical protein
MTSVLSHSHSELILQQFSADQTPQHCSQMPLRAAGCNAAALPATSALGCWLQCSSTACNTCFECLEPGSHTAGPFVSAQCCVDCEALPACALQLTHMLHCSALHAHLGGCCCETLGHIVPVNQLVAEGGHVVGPAHTDMTAGLD